MKIRMGLASAALSTCLALPAYAQVPGPEPVTPPAPQPPPLAPQPPPAQWPAPVAPQPQPPPPAAAWQPVAWTPPPAPPPKPPVTVAGRAGFGIGVFVSPFGGGAVTGGGEQFVGVTPGVRVWATEGVVLLPAVRLAISYEEDSDDPSGEIGPELAIGFAVYRGRTTRLLLTVGAAFAYTAGEQVKVEASPSFYKTIGFAVPGGLQLEQFFNPRISVIVGAQAPLFYVTTTSVDGSDYRTTVGAALDASRFGAGVFFYTD